MKTILKFNLPEDKELYQIYSQAPEMHAILHGMIELTFMAEKNEWSVETLIEQMRSTIGDFKVAP